ncbi:cell division protein SepF [Actinomadura alba]|uniref:Cell division protein SepF n=1 Tax=Actinomadura alba TaxID=406431 RepID=A0ABR7M151_9ACTN|nr:cell division protein SepF [Actinomadura alba]MBC6470519.1 cell division protein SepF [Actinomadura alba]
MAGLLRRTMLSLGFAEETDRVDAYDDEPGDETLDARPATAEPRRHHIATLHARQFNSDAPVIGDLFRTGATVIMDLTETDEPTVMRFLDFGAGLAFGHGGRIERIAPAVFLLSPEGVAA